MGAYSDLVQAFYLISRCSSEDVLERVDHESQSTGRALRVWVNRVPRWLTWHVAKELDTRLRAKNVSASALIPGWFDPRSWREAALALTRAGLEFSNEVDIFDEAIEAIPDKVGSIWPVARFLDRVRSGAPLRSRPGEVVAGNETLTAEDLQVAIDAVVPKPPEKPVEKTET
jgi:hypothetical protein